MDLKYKYIFLFIIAGLVLVSCQPAVRFSEKGDYSNAGTSSKSKVSPGKSSVKTDETRISKLELSQSGKDMQLKIIRDAERWIGVSYCYGGETRDCIDCSGFVMTIYQESGYQLPRTAADQYDFVHKVKSSDRMVGDLVFFSKNGKIYHVGIYAGGNEIIHSSSSSGVIRQSLDDNFFSGKIEGYGRVIGTLAKN
jgi:lipoprotein Spr